MAKIENMYAPSRPIRIVSATSLFDGHDAAINVMRRIMQTTGAEVVHLGHSRSVAEIVEAAVEEDAHAVAITSYQGGHMEFFTYMVDMLKEHGCEHIRVFGGGGGVIQPDEIDELRAHGVAMIYSPDDGRRLGLQGMINHLMERSDFPTVDPNGEGAPAKVDADGCLPGYPGRPAPTVDELSVERPDAIARMLTLAEINAPAWQRVRDEVLEKAKGAKTPVIGVTGTGGAGKSSLVDEQPPPNKIKRPVTSLSRLPCSIS